MGENIALLASYVESEQYCGIRKYFEIHIRQLPQYATHFRIKCMLDEILSTFMEYEKNPYIFFFCFTFRAALIFLQLKFLCKYKSGHSLGEKLRHFHQAHTSIFRSQIQMKLYFICTQVCVRCM